MRTKVLTAILTLLAMFTLCGCDNEGEQSSSLTPEEMGYIAADVVDVSTTCGQYYAEFLKLGSTSEEDIAAQHPDWVLTDTGTRKTWDVENGDNDMFSYWRDTESDLSFYAKTFPVNVSDIKSWINAELVGLDNMFNTAHHRTDMQGVSWYYEWETKLESAKLQVYATGETGKYTALVSFARSGPTAVSQLQSGVTSS